MWQTVPEAAASSVRLLMLESCIQIASSEDDDMYPVQYYPISACTTMSGRLCLKHSVGGSSSSSSSSTDCLE